MFTIAKLRIKVSYFLINYVYRRKELLVHELAWKILTNEQEQVEEVDAKKVFCFFRIILDPAYLESTKCSILIKDYLEKIDEQ